MRNTATWLAAAGMWLSMTAASIPAEVGDAVQRAVSGLSSARAAERRAAEETLLELGPDVLPHLPDPVTLTDRAVQDALVRIQQKLEARAAIESLQPSRVTFHGRGTTPQLLLEIERQTGNAVAIARDAIDGQELDVAWERATFWEAVTELEERGGRRLFLTAPESSAAAVASTDAKSQPDVATAFRVSIKAAARRSGAGATEPNPRQVRLCVQAEPRLQPLFVRCRDATLSAQIDGTTLTPLNPSAVREVDFSAGAAVWDVIYLGAATADASRIVISGTVDVEAISAVQELRFGPLNRALPLIGRRGTAQAALTGIAVDSTTGELLVDVLLRYAAGGPVFESHRVAALRQPGWIEFPDGRRLFAEADREVTREQDGAIGLRYRVLKPPADWRTAAWVCPVPSVVTRISVPFTVQ